MHRWPRSRVCLHLFFSIRVPLDSLYSLRPSSSLTSTSFHFRSLFPALHLSLCSFSNSRAVPKPSFSPPAELFCLFIREVTKIELDSTTFRSSLFHFPICTSSLSFIKVSTASHLVIPHIQPCFRFSWFHFVMLIINYWSCSVACFEVTMYFFPSRSHQVLPVSNHKSVM